jgi:propionate CoA-transferase
LTPDGIALREVAPGIDAEGDVIAHMGFRPIVESLAVMDARIFRPEPMDLKRDLLHLDLEDRITLDRGENRLYINFEKMRINSADDVTRIRDRVEALCAPSARRST